MYETTTIDGIVERITFHNAENGFAVFKAAVKGERDLVIVVGVVSSIHPGEYITCKGMWVNNKDFGKQFKASHIQVTQPTTTAGIEKYLASGMIKGIGPVYAKKLVETFSTDVFRIIEEEPQALMQIDGIGKMRVSKITKGWQQQKHVREIMLFLHQHGVTTLRALRIYKTYGEQAIEVIKKNPYQLARDIRGVGFLSADKIALNIGITLTAPQRLSAGLYYALMTAMDDGHCGLPQEQLLKDAAELLQVEEMLLPSALESAIADKSVILDNQHIYLPFLYHQEKMIAEQLVKLKEATLPWSAFDADKSIDWAEKITTIKLAPSQRAVLESALKHKVSIITGGPGVGKTTLMKCLLLILKQKLQHIMLCAPTGRAARRLSESSGFEAKTIHRLLEPNQTLTGFKMNEDNPLVTQLLIVDESSMIDVPIMSALLKALPSSAALILVGDVDQLPSVGPGQVLADIIDSQQIPTFHLTEIFRQAATSTIIKNAHAVNNGRMPDMTNKENTDFFFVNCDEPEDGVNKIRKIIQERLPRKFGYDPVQDVQVLAPMSRGKIGARALNEVLQQALNPSPAASIAIFGITFGVGDKVIQTANDYDKEVYNGDVGIIKAIDTENQLITIVFEEKIVEYEYADMDDVQLAYAITIHKSQGSEYPVVVIPFTMQSYMMLQRNLLYTAITRGKKLVIVVGQEKTVRIAVQHRGKQIRHTTLKYWLENSI